MSKKIVVIGSSNIDLIMQVERLPVPGETITGGVFHQTFGGKGANQAVGAARSGGDVTFVSCLGDDSFAEAVIESFKEDGINTKHILIKEKVATGTALIMIDKAGENCITVAPGANYELLPEHIDAIDSVLKEASFILLQCEIHPATLSYVIDKAWELGVKTILNLAPARDLLPEQLAKLHLLIVNESEAAFLLKSPVENIEQAKAAAHQLATQVANSVIVTLGAKGAYAVTPSDTVMLEAFKVKAVDTTAAGDVFCGALTTALVEEMSIKDAMRFASAASAVAVTRLGAQDSAPTRAEIEAMLNK